jgi:iron(III) transport system ATP-binding protein
MGDRLAVMSCGRLEQVDTPEAVFQNPATRFVAEFMGQTDFLPGVVTGEGIRTEIGLLHQTAVLPAGSQVEVAFRADDVDFWPQPGAAASIEARRFQGMANLYRLRLPSGRRVHALKPHACVLPAGAPVEVQASPGHALAWFPLD